MALLTSLTNIPRDRDLYIYGIGERPLTYYDALVNSGYDRIRGFVSTIETGNFLGLDILTLEEFSTEYAYNSGLVLAYEPPEIVEAASKLPYVYPTCMITRFLNEPELISERLFLLEHCPGVDTAFDVGCNHGMMSLIMMDHVKRVIGFEPNEILHEPISRVMYNFPQFKLEKLALSNEVGEFDFFLDLKTAGGSSLTHSDLHHSKSVKVQVSTLDDYCNSTGQFPGFLKIDAEGNDGKVILGGKEVIATHKPPILFEMWRFNWERLEEAVFFLDEFYTFKDLTTNMPFIPQNFAKHAQHLADLGWGAGHTNIGCIPKKS